MVLVEINWIRNFFSDPEYLHHGVEKHNVESDMV